MRSRGAVYQAIGRKYIDQAAASARSAKRTNRWLSTCLFCDDMAYASDTHSRSFDEIVDIMDGRTRSYVDMLRARNQLFGIKVPVALHSPYEQCLLIDSDTVFVGDVSAAFEQLEWFDVLVCEDAVHLVDTDTSKWQATGLVDLHNRGYFNSGVVYFNNSPPVQDFMRSWADIYSSDDPVASRNDQDALNYVLGRPAQYMENLSFCPTAIRSQQFNAACRFWMELWDAGMWDDVRLLHTWMSQMIEDRISKGAMDWSAFFVKETGPGPEYVRRFAIARDLLDRDQKRALYDKIKRSPIDLRQYLQHVVCNFDVSDRLAKSTSLYCVDNNGFGVDYKRMIEIISPWISSSPSILQVGVGHYVAGQAGFNPSPHYRVGYDLEFLQETFGASRVVGLTRLRYTAYRQQKIWTSFRPYQLGLEWHEILRANLVIDVDASVPSNVRVSNVRVLVDRAMPNSVIYVSNVSSEEILMLQRLAKDLPAVESISLCDREPSRDLAIRLGGV